MTSLRRRLVNIAAVAAVASLALTACTPGGGDPTGSPEPTAGPTGGTPLPDDQQNFTFIPAFGWAGSDISKAPLEIGMNIALKQTLEPIVRLDKDAVPQPHLATGWEWTSPTTLEITLREGVTFSDGTPFTSADVKGTIERYLAQQAALHAVLSIIVGMETPDDHTIVLTTSAPTGTLVGVLSLVLIGKGEFSHAESSEADDAYWARPVGTGPFIITEYVPNDRFVFERNDDYWGEKAKLKTLTMRQVTDINGKITALSNNQAQAIQNVVYDQHETVRNLPNVTLEQFDSLSYYFVWFMNDRAPLDDPRVRRAMWMALDLPTIVEALYGDSREVMDSFCPSTAFGCVPANGMPEYDLEGAKALLAEAGHPGGGFTVDVIFSLANATDNALAQALISAWRDLGVTVEPRGLDSASWLEAFVGMDWYLDFQPNQTATGDADYTLNRLYSCAAARLGYCNPALDALMTQAQQSADPAERLRLYQQVVDIMAVDTPAIPLFQTKVNVAYRDTVQGLTVPPTEFVDFSTVYLTD